MNDKESSIFTRSNSRRLLIGSLIIAIVLVFALLVRGRSHQAIAPVRVANNANNVRTDALPVRKQRVDAPKPIVVDDTGKIAICGFGKVPIDTTDPFAVGQYVGAVTKKAGARWLSALQDSDDLRARAAGLLLEGKITGDDRMRAVAEQTRDALVQLAVGAGDPAIYAMAVILCGTDSSTPIKGACEQISLRAWAQMDVDNAVPWLLLAEKAREKHNIEAEADAFSQATKAHKIDSYNDSLYAFSVSEIPKDATPLDQSYFATAVIGIEAATRAVQYTTVSKHCSTDAVRDTNVREQCNTLAELLLAKGTTLLDLGLGIRIGARVGWSPERVNDLTQQENALMQAIVQSTPTGNGDLWTCDGVRLINAYMGQRARLGELGAARDALERSGQTVQEMAQKQTTFMENIRRDALRREQEKPPETAP
jgi:hypothetical protein